MDLGGRQVMSSMRMYNPTHFGGSVWIDRGARALVEQYRLEALLLTGEDREHDTLYHVDKQTSVPVD